MLLSGHLLPSGSVPTIAKMFASTAVLVLSIFTFMLGRATAGHTPRTALQESLRAVLQFQMMVLEMEMAWCHAVLEIDADGQPRIRIRRGEMTDENDHVTETSDKMADNHRSRDFNEPDKRDTTEESTEAAESTEGSADMNDWDDSGHSDWTEADEPTGFMVAIDEDRVSAYGSETAERPETLERPRFCFDPLITALEWARGVNLPIKWD